MLSAGLTDSGDPAEIEQNAMAITSHNINTDMSLHSNNGLRNQMQRAGIPRTTMTSTGLSIEQLRASKKAAKTSVAQQPAQSDLALNNMLGDMNDAMDDFQALVDFGPGGSGV